MARKTLTQSLIALGRKGLSELGAKFDSWENDVSGFGTSDDKTTYTRFVGPAVLSPQELSNLYHGDDLAARMVDVVGDEMLREGFTVDTGDPGLNAALAEKLDGLNADARYADGIRWGRGYGEGAILIGADDGRSAARPLVPERARDINYLHVIDGRYYWPLTYYQEPGHPMLGEPELFGVMPPGNSAQPTAIVHESRLIRFGGAPTGDQERASNQSRDYSVLQRAYEPLRAFNTGFKAVEILLTDGHQSVFKMQGLAEMIGLDGEALAQARLKVINMYRSVLRAIVVDAGDKEGGVGAEDFSRNSVSFSDIPKTLDSFMLRLSAAVQIPVTILMGQSPAGMNATGESDFRWFYDRIRSLQNLKLAPKIRRLLRVLFATRSWQATPKALTVKFPPLWTEAPLQAAQTRAALITGDAAGVTAQIWLPEEVALHRGKAGGYETEIQLSPEAARARAAMLAGEYTAITPDPTTKAADKPNVELAPTDAASVIKVNEARASLGLPALEGEDGELTLAEFKLKSAPAPGGGGGFGKPPGGGAARPFDEPKLDGGDDQPRDDDGRFAETEGSAAGKSDARRAARAKAQEHFDAQAKKVNDVARARGHSEAADRFLNRDRHAVSKAERNGEANETSDAVTAFLHDAQQADADYKGTVYRGTTPAELDQIVGEGQNKTTWSVSKDPEGSAHFAKKGGVLLVMPKDHGAVPVDGLDGSNTYNEALIPRGTKFTIHSERVVKGVRVVTLQRRK